MRPVPRAAQGGGARWCGERLWFDRTCVCMALWSAVNATGLWEYLLIIRQGEGSRLPDLDRNICCHVLVGTSSRPFSPAVGRVWLSAGQATHAHAVACGHFAACAGMPAWGSNAPCLEPPTALVLASHTFSFPGHVGGVCAHFLCCVCCMRRKCMLPVFGRRCSDCFHAYGGMLCCRPALG